MNGGSVLDDINLKSKRRAGRPKKWSVEEKKVVIQVCTRDAKQRAKSYVMLAKECPFKIDERTVRRIMTEAGYDRRRSHVPDAAERVVDDEDDEDE